MAAGNKIIVVVGHIGMKHTAVIEALKTVSPDIVVVERQEVRHIIRNVTPLEPIKLVAPLPELVSTKYNCPSPYAKKSKKQRKK